MAHSLKLAQTKPSERATDKGVHQTGNKNCIKQLRLMLISLLTNIGLRLRTTAHRTDGQSQNFLTWYKFRSGITENLIDRRRGQGLALAILVPLFAQRNPPEARSRRCSGDKSLLLGRTSSTTLCVVPLPRNGKGKTQKALTVFVKAF